MSRRRTVMAQDFRACIEKIVSGRHGVLWQPSIQIERVVQEAHAKRIAEAVEALLESVMNDEPADVLDVQAARIRVLMGDRMAQAKQREESKQ